MMRKAIVLVPALCVLALVFLFLALLAEPLQRGATLREALAVLPQAVVWILPPLLATPILIALAFGVRPHWHRLRNPEPTVLPGGSLAPLARSLRLAGESRLAQSRAVSRLARIATDLAASQYGGTEERAWEIARQRLRATHPRVAEFLERHEMMNLSGAEFAALVRETLDALERQQEEA